MSAEHLGLKDTASLGLDWEGYVNLGLARAKNLPCILCGNKSHKAGICISDGSKESRKKMNTPAGENNHRLAFYSLCQNCLGTDYEPKVKDKILERTRSF